MIMMLTHLAGMGIDASRAPTHNPGSTFWTVVVTAGIVIAIIAGLLQVTGWIRNRRFRTIEKDLLEQVSLELNIEDTRSKLVKYSELATDLRTQVEQELPRAAINVYMTERLRQLSGSISRDYTEYKAIEQELGNVEMETNIDRQVRKLIENSILPGYKIQQRRNFWITTLGLSAALLAISPIDTNHIISTYFSILDNAGKMSAESSIRALFFGVLCVTLVFTVSIPLIPRNPIVDRGFRLTLQRSKLLVISLVAVTLILGGYGCRYGAVHKPTSVHGTSHVGAYEDLAGFAFNIAVVLLSFALAGWWLLWRHKLLPDGSILFRTDTLSLGRLRRSRDRS
jgi:hypothetical protein